MIEREIRIGFAGLGVVGQGVWKHLERNASALEQRLGVRIVLARAAVRDLTKSRGVTIAPEQLTDDAIALARDPSLDIVCELIGGTALAREVTLAALARGKVVVTANKALICTHGAELFRAAAEGGGHYLFEASVCGGIPIIKTMRESLVANRFRLLYGIFNGTCNYILTRMERESLPFHETLQDARRLGYVEADEALDLDGWDAAHKAVILAYLAHGKWFSLEDVEVEGIRNIDLPDLQWASSLGYKVKLLGMISRDLDSNRVVIRVHPALISKRNVVANVDDVFNAVSVTGDVVGTTVLIGRGAGQDATASAVISDIADAVSAIRSGSRALSSEVDLEFYRRLGADLVPALPTEIRSEYYLRLSVEDRPGVLADVAAVLARHEVSIATVLQRSSEETDNPVVSLILTTHECSEAGMRSSLHDLDALASVRSRPLLLPIVDFEN